MDLTLYKVGASGRVALGELAGGVEYYNAAKDDDTGVVTLTPVKIVGATSKRPDPIVEGNETAPSTGETPWDQ